MKQDLLKDLLDQVAQKFGYSDPYQWQDGVYGLLSEEIEKTTRYIISRNTLKRLYGKIPTPKEYTPQMDTRNALAKYAGYLDWNSYRLARIAERNVRDQEISFFSVFTSWSNLIGKNTVIKSPYFFGMIVVFVIGLISYFFLPDPGKDYSRIKVSLENPVDTAPFTLVFNYEIPPDINDSIFLGVGDSRYYLKPEKKTFMHSIYLPVYSFVYLWNKDRIIIRAIPIKAYSRNVECYYQSLKRKIRLVPQADFLGEGAAGLKRTFFAKNNLDSAEFLSTFYKVKDFGVDGDNFTLRTRYNMDPSQRFCEFFQVKLFADSGHHELELRNKGCAQDNFVAPAELYFGSKFEKLTNLSAEPGQWHELEIEVRNKHFRIILDSTERFATTYKRPLGNISVLRMQFNGFGKIDYYRILDSKGRFVDREEF